LNSTSIGGEQSSWRVRLPWVAAVGVMLILVVAAAVLPKSVSWDPSYGMLAADHFVTGRSSDLTLFRMADAAELSRDLNYDPGYWAPGYQFIPWLCRFGSLSWGVALQITVAASLALGLVGWGIYFWRTLESAALAACLLLAVACSRYSWVHTVVYQGGDLLLWAAAPWVMLMNLRAITGPPPWIALASLATAGVFLLKYSAAFMALGFGAFWLWSRWNRSATTARLVLWFAILVASFTAIRIMGFPSGSNPSSTRSGWLILEGIGSLGLVASGPTDFESMAAKALETLSLSGTEWHIGAAGFSLLVVTIVALILAQRQSNQARTINGDAGTARMAGLIVGATDILALAGLYAVGGNLGPQARLGRVAGLFLLPVAIHILIRSWRSRSLVTRWMTRGVIAALVILPPLYGVAAGVPKLVKRWQNRRSSIGSDGVVCSYLSAATPHDQFFAEVVSFLPEKNTLLVVAHPQLVFPRKSGRILVFDGLKTLSLTQFQTVRFNGIPREGIALLTQQNEADEPRVELLRKAFSDVPSWVRYELRTERGWELWISER